MVNAPVPIPDAEMNLAISPRVGFSSSSSASRSNDCALSWSTITPPRSRTKQSLSAERDIAIIRPSSASRQIEFIGDLASDLPCNARDACLALHGKGGVPVGLTRLRFQNWRD